MTQEVMTSEIRHDLLSVQEKGLELYTAYHRERFVERSKRLSDTIHRTNIKNFQSIHSQKKADQTSKKGQKKEFSQVQKVLDLARERKYDSKELLKYDLIPSTYLFDSEGLMNKPQKSSLGIELEKTLSAADYIKPEHWKDMPTVYLIDVMQQLRKMNVRQMSTFGDLCDSFFKSILHTSRNASRIDLVFDSYITGSAKDTERLRRSRTPAIDLSAITAETPLCVDMDAFWSSNSNKIKLEKLVAQWVIKYSEEKGLNTMVVLSGMIGEEPVLCQSVKGTNLTMHPDLDTDSEEADVRFIPHAMHATKGGADRVVILSNDIDVLVLVLYFWQELHAHGLSELWVRGGTGDTTRYIPVHELAPKTGPVSKVLPALHALLYLTSKVGTKPAALKADPVQYLKDFGRDPHSDNIEDTFLKAEEYLVQVLKRGTSIKVMDDLRHWMYHHSKSMTVDNLPPTSHLLRGHILRAFYATHIQIHCLDSQSIDPVLYGFEESDGLLLPSKNSRVCPDDLIDSCRCLKCATVHCTCRKSLMPCCLFCKCHSVNSALQDCRNPYSE